MEGGSYQLAFALFASVNVHVDGIDDSVVLGEVFGLGHIWTVGAERSGRQQPKVAKGGRYATHFRSASAAKTAKPDNEEVAMRSGFRLEN